MEPYLERANKIRRPLTNNDVFLALFAVSSVRGETPIVTCTYATCNIFSRFLNLIDEYVLSDAITSSFDAIRLWLKMNFGWTVC